MKIVNKSRPPVTLDISESGEIIAVDIYGHPVPLRMGDALRERFSKLAHHSSRGPQPGTALPDGTIYAGISPDTGKAFYAAAQDAPKLLTWHKGRRYAVNSTKHGHNDWRVPTSGELNVLFNNRAAIGGFNESGLFPAGWYWSSSDANSTRARNQRFSDGAQDYTNYLKFFSLSVRCVRG